MQRNLQWAVHQEQRVVPDPCRHPAESVFGYLWVYLEFVPSPPQTTIKIDNSPKCLAQIISRMLNCTNILDNVPSSSGPDRAQRQQSNLIIPPNVWQTNQDRMKNVELNMHFRICALPPLRQSDLITLPNIWHKNQDRIKNVELYTHLRNCALPPQGPKTTIHFDNSSNDDCWWLSGVDGCQLKNEPVVDGCQMLMVVRCWWLSVLMAVLLIDVC